MMNLRQPQTPPSNSVQGGKKNGRHATRVARASLLRYLKLTTAFSAVSVSCVLFAQKEDAVEQGKWLCPENYLKYNEDDNLCHAAAAGRPLAYDPQGGSCEKNYDRVANYCMERGITLNMEQGMALLDLRETENCEGELRPLTKTICLQDTARYVFEEPAFAVLADTSSVQQYRCASGGKIDPWPDNIDPTSCSPDPATAAVTLCDAKPLEEPDTELPTLLSCPH